MTENPPSHWDPDCCLLLQGGSNSLDADELNYLYSEQGPTFEKDIGRLKHVYSCAIWLVGGLSHELLGKLKEDAES